MRQSSRIMLIIMISHLNACQEQLDVENPNAPQFSIARTETGILNFAMGAVYVAPTKYSGAGFLWNEVQSFHEVMGDAVGTDLTQLGLNQIGCPERILLDNGSSMPNPHSPANQKGLIRQMNVNQNAYDNPLFYEWTILYSINNGCNMLLSLVDDVEL